MIITISYDYIDRLAIIVRDHFMHDQVLGLHLQLLCHLLLLRIAMAYQVVLQPCGIEHQHHTCRVEVIEPSMSASPEECMHASWGKILICWPLVRLRLPGCLSKSPLWLGHFLQLPSNSTAHTALHELLQCNLSHVLVSCMRHY